ncbi:hypothetical protein ACFL59_04535 [Planctomycetota bacterium]
MAKYKKTVSLDDERKRFEARRAILGERLLEKLLARFFEAGGTAAKARKWPQIQKEAFSDLEEIFPPKARKTKGGKKALQKRVKAAAADYLKPPPPLRAEIWQDKRGIVGYLLGVAVESFKEFQTDDVEARRKAYEEWLEHELERIPTFEEKQKEAQEALLLHRTMRVLSFDQKSLLAQLTSGFEDVVKPKYLTMEERKEKARRELRRRRLERQRSQSLRSRRTSTITISCRVSGLNAQALKMLLHTEEDLEGKEVQLGFCVFEYDQVAHAYYESVHTGTETITGALVDPYKIGDKPTGDPETPVNHELELEIKPTSADQSIHLAHGANCTQAVQWADEEA